ncbi:MAG: guanylate kinase [Eubacteriales bacterium]|nr:guanylate kinase [Eubacteriales bacterium]
MLKIKREKGIIFCCSGPSGVGKDTLIAEVRKKYPELVHSISLTTRQPRPGEVPGQDYHFCEKEEFERLIESGEIIEYDVFCDNYYGTLAQVLREAEAGGTDIFLDITVAGSLRLKELFPDAVLIFILPPSQETLIERLKARRTEAESVINSRVEKAKEEVKNAAAFDYVVVNDTIKDAVSCLEAIVLAERSRSGRFLFN